MASESQILSQIENVVIDEWHIWTIGITDDPVQCKRAHGNPILWQHWYAIKATSARRIVDYFLDKGMRLAIGNDTDPKYVYIFR